MRRAFRRVLLCLGVGVLFAGCLSPTLPLPPPSPPDVSKVGDGEYELRGSLPMAGTVYVRNERSSSGVLKDVDSGLLYQFVVGAQPGDVMALWYEASDTSQFYGDRSQTIEFEIKDSVPPATSSDGGTRADGGLSEAGRP